MGQKQSAHSELEKSLEKLTEAERQKLLELFESGKESGIPIHDETYYKILEVEFILISLVTWHSELISPRTSYFFKSMLPFSLISLPVSVYPQCANPTKGRFSLANQRFVGSSGK